MDIVNALRQLFDTFKPGGEGQALQTRTALAKGQRVM